LDLLPELQTFPFPKRFFVQLEPTDPGSFFQQSSFFFFRQRFSAHQVRPMIPLVELMAFSCAQRRFLPLTVFFFLTPLFFFLDGSPLGDPFDPRPTPLSQVMISSLSIPFS